MLNQWSDDAEPITWREDEEKESIYGARMGETYSDCWRFLIGNIGTLQNERTGYVKNKIDNWKNLATTNIDLNIISGLNKDMGMLPHEEKLENITKGWWNGMCRLAFLKEIDRAIRTLQQPGRTTVYSAIHRPIILEMAKTKIWKIRKIKNLTKTKTKTKRRETKGATERKTVQRVVLIASRVT